MKKEKDELKKEKDDLQNKLNKQQKTGAIYAFKHKKYGTIDYVGYHGTTEISDRL